MYKVIQTKSLNKCFRTLAKHGKKGKDAITKVRAALTEAGTEGSIASLKRTNHGESRLENIEKYDLGSGYRLVVQLVDGINNVRAFLFTGDHEDSEQWLESHKDYTWVKSEKDHTLEFIQVSEKEPRSNRIVDPDIDSAEELRELPLLRHLNSEDWSALSIEDALKDYVLSISSETWECDPGSILEHIEKESGTECAILFDDLFTHSHKGELGQLSTRIKLELGAAKITSGSELVAEMQEPHNSEIFVTWEEVSSLPDNSSWADWLLFLHPEQKTLSTKEFKGAARLRGVSGSGKTCVMLHRARFLAKTLKEPILLVTLTESMRRLLESLISELCGVESSFIRISTINALAQSIVKELHHKGEAAYRMADNDLKTSLLKDTVEFVKQHKHFKSSRLAKLNYHDLKRFVDEEVFYIRSRLRYSEFEKYLDPKSFKRHGRKIGLAVEGRNVLLDAARYRINGLRKAFGLDYEGVVSAALSLLTHDGESLDTFGWAKVETSELENKLRYYAPYRCVLVDEVQDLSQLEVAMIGALPATNETSISNIENGLFLVGDGAQTIYNKGFVLKSCGINVSNRSYVLKKNYRNSKEIMLASYSLIEKYEFADVDEDNIANPTKPDFPLKTGEKPFIVKCKTEDDEVRFVCGLVKGIVSDYQSIEDAEEYPEICIIGLNSSIRKKLSRKLTSSSVNWGELKQTASIESRDCIAISTIESAKGHEFQYVFIIGVNEGHIPHKYLNDNDIAREASRLYVGMTRAQDCLYISYNIERGNQPSRFLIDVQSYCNEYEFRANRLSLIE